MLLGGTSSAREADAVRLHLQLLWAAAALDGPAGPQLFASQWGQLSMVAHLSRAPAYSSYPGDASAGYCCSMERIMATFRAFR